MTERACAPAYCAGGLGTARADVRSRPQPARWTDELVAGRARAWAAGARRRSPVAAWRRRGPRTAVASCAGCGADRHERAATAHRARRPQRCGSSASRDRQRSGGRSRCADVRRLLTAAAGRSAAAWASRVHGPAARDGDRRCPGAMVALVRCMGDARAGARRAPGAALEAEMPRLPLSYFEATVPVPDDWANGRPCAYLLLSAPYAQSAAEARARGWPVIEVHGVQHLAIATDASPVTQALLDLERSLSNRPGSAASTD